MPRINKELVFTVVGVGSAPPPPRKLIKEALACYTDRRKTKRGESEVVIFEVSAGCGQEGGGDQFKVQQKARPPLIILQAYEEVGGA